MRKVRQAHRLPPRKWEQALFVMCLFIILLIAVLTIYPTPTT